MSATECKMFCVQLLSLLLQYRQAGTDHEQPTNTKQQVSVRERESVCVCVCVSEECVNTVIALPYLNLSTK